MGFKVEQKIISSEDLLAKLPLSSELKNFLTEQNEEIKNIFLGKDDRKILIVGPCSAWPESAVLEYAKELKNMSDKVKDKIKIVMRLYSQKPRTTVGWTGPSIMPDVFESSDINSGLHYCRKMMLDVLNIGLPIASESLFLDMEKYFSDLISYIAIGARTTESQEHRGFASMSDIPVGMKNSTSGSINTGVNSVIAAQNSHTFLFDSSQIKSSGNKISHLILRGGNGKPNISKEKIEESYSLMTKNKVVNPTIIVDASHENCIGEDGKKNPLLQPQIVYDILDMNLDCVKGFMVESFIKSGNQKLANSELEMDMGGLSITDPCIGIDETRVMILKMWEMINS